jgi:hypothetical protein
MVGDDLRIPTLALRRTPYPYKTPQMKTNLALVGFVFLAFSPFAFAVDDSTPPAPSELNPAAPVQAAGEESAETENNHLKTLDGSQSPFSGQFNITYNGSTISHPFSADAPNPGGQVPAPLVVLSGTVAVRYRFDKTTTMGVGTGVTTETPFQGPKNTTLADPYIDVARTFYIDKVRNRVDFQVTDWTDHQHNDDFGYRLGLTFSDQIIYPLPSGLTLGFFLEIDYNFFSGDAKYATATATPGVLGSQIQWDIVTDPFVEYRINKTFNLRTAFGIASLNKRNLANDFALAHPSVYETVGVGMQLLPDWFIYPYFQYFPGNISSNNTVTGFSTIVNLF